MFKGIDLYLDAFRDSLEGSDRAVVQDALSDAEDHLVSAFATEKEEHPELPDEQVMDRVVDEYGTPDEVADFYRRVEEVTRPVLVSATPRQGGKFMRFCGIITDPSAWAAMLYMILSMATGIIYFTWAVTSLSVTAGLLVLIVGLPLAWLVFLSFRGLALVEGRIVEALLGVRMPRRPVLIRKGDGWFGSLKGVFSAKSTWTSLVYLLLMLPLGIIYFTLFLSLVAITLSMVASPVLELVLGVQVFDLRETWWIPVWLMPFVVVAGGFLFLATLHLAKLVGRLHGKFARALLVN